LQVAAERKKLDGVNSRIQTAQRDLRALETEFDTRANMVQLERWNGDTLALSAPTAGQFVRDEAQLASLDVNAGSSGVESAALVVPSLPPVSPGTPAVATLAPAVQMAAATPAPAPTVIKASAVNSVEPAHPAAAQPPRERLASAVRAKEAVAKVRPQAVAMLDDKLLSDTTLGDLLSGARHEAGHRR